LSSMPPKMQASAFTDGSKQRRRYQQSADSLR
jgi:hypothetical protein